MLTVTDYLALPASPADARAAYGGHPDQFIDLYLPAGPGPHPTLILIHGGCWRDQYGLAPLGQLAAALRGRGLAVASLEYRRLGGAGGWPATFHDVAAAADELRALAPHYGLDLGRVAAAGHSAGGHLALWLAARPRIRPGAELYRPDPLALRGVLGLAPLADLAAGAERGLCGGACAEILGGELGPARLAQASPAAMLPLGLPQRLIGGAADPIVPPDYLEGYAAAARAAGDPVGLELLAGAGHFEPVVAAGPAWQALCRALETLSIG